MGTKFQTLDSWLVDFDKNVVRFHWPVLEFLLSNPIKLERVENQINACNLAEKHDIVAW